MADCTVSKLALELSADLDTVAKVSLGSPRLLTAESLPRAQSSNTFMIAS
jgi:hypothetical protein